MIDAADRALAADLLAGFRAAGAVPVETPILQPAGALLDLYGEDIRARAFVTQDPAWGEAMLRPDFTVAVVQAHLERAAATARYCYAGEVFRRQEGDPDRAREYLQVGFEVFDGTDPAAADAEAFDALARALAPWGAVPATGDLGLLIAAVEALTLSPPRRAALRRHIWRPARFRRLMERFSTAPAPTAARAALLAGLEDAPAEALVEAAGPAVGLREPAEVAARLDALARDAREPALPPEEVAAVDAILTLEATMADALGPLRALVGPLPGLAAAVDRVAARADALVARGHDPAALRFAPAHLRTAMEYYDGFVFTLAAPGRPDLPPLATGGRYDALTAILGGGRGVPAVGGVVRPGLLRGLRRAP